MLLLVIVIKMNSSNKSVRYNYMYHKLVVCIRPVFSRVDKKRGTYRVKESVRLNRPTVEPNRIRKLNGRRISTNGENSDEPTGSEWAMRRNSTQILQIGELYCLLVDVLCCIQSLAAKLFCLP